MLSKYIDLANTAEQVCDEPVMGRVLIIDGDSFCYKASATSKKLTTAISRFQQEVLTAMFICKAETAIVHLTHKDSDKAGRHKIKGFKEYQANRSGNSRPPLLHELREAVCRSENIRTEYTCQLHKVVEADDACMIDAYKYGEQGVMWSEDKDLRHTPYPYYDQRRQEIIQAKGIGSLWFHTTETGNQSLHGIGRLFFWAQMLMGDTADNIKGIDKYYGKAIGYVGAYEELHYFNDTSNESTVANMVLDAYRHSDQNPLPEGYLLHMMRDWGDSFHDVLEELELSAENKEFLEDCETRDWFEE